MHIQILSKKARKDKRIKRAFRNSIIKSLYDIKIKENEIMATLDNLTAVLLDLSEDVSKLTDDVLDRLATLQVLIDELVAGAVSQEQIDALTAQAAEIDAAVEALDAAVAPPTEIVPV